MNLIPFVVAMILLLSALTYSQLQSFRTQATILRGLHAFFEVNERESLNEAMAEKYEHLLVRESPAASGEKGNPAQATGKLNLRILLNQSLRTRDPNRYNAYVELTKRLIHRLYQDDPYFQELAQEHPDYLDPFFEALSKNEKIYKLSDLEHLDLQDTALNYLLYRLMKPRPCGESLHDYVTVYHADDLRLFLAPRALLEAIFNDPWAAQTVEEERYDLYMQVKKETLSIAEASKQLDACVKGYTTSLQPYLNTQVSKTNPRRR